MSASPPEEERPRARGLPAVQKARDARASGKMRWPPTKFWGYVALVLAVTGILHWKRTQGENDRTRAKLLADQRGVAKELGPRWFPLREKLEGWTTGLAKGVGQEVVDREALAKFDFRSIPGIYLRLRVEDAQSPEAIRKGARDSLRDGFTGCLMRVPNPDPTAGRECKRTRDCPPREFCNEQDHCAPPAQPFNVRVAYRSMHLLSDEWVREVQDATAELRLRAFVLNFDDAMRDDIPLAVELLTKAQYFLLVLDETPPGEPLPAADAGTSAAEAVQAMPHFARIGAWRLSDDKPLLRIRREASGQLLGASPTANPKVLAATQRQMNSCALALEVRQAMGDPNAATAPPPQ
jgi:hypothetical protein